MTYTNNYTAPTWRQIANSKRSLSEKLANNAKLLEDEFDAIEAAIPDISGLETDVGDLESAVGKAAIHTAILGIKPIVVDPTEVGYDFADGTGGLVYGAFVAPADITLVSAKLYVTEAYVKDTADAAVVIQDNGLTPVEFASLTFGADGYAVGDVVDLVVAIGQIPALTMINVNITSTVDTSGTGHGLIVLEYTRN